MLHRCYRRRHAGQPLPVGENLIDRLQNRLSRTERHVERDARQRSPCICRDRRERVALRIEHFRRRALKAIDRLFLVAYREQRAQRRLS